MTNKELAEFNKKRKLKQVCILTRDIDKTMKNWVKYLGIGPWKVLTFTEETVKNLKVYGKPVKEPFKFIIALSNMGGDFEFELIQPVYGPMIYDKFLNEKGEGLHHIKEEISDADINRVLEEYKAKGIEVTQTGQFDTDVHYYLDTEPYLDFIYELGNCPYIDVPPEMYRIYPEEK